MFHHLMSRTCIYANVIDILNDISYTLDAAQQWSYGEMDITGVF